MSRPGLAEEVARRMVEIRFGPGSWAQMSARARLDFVATADSLIATTSLGDFVAYFTAREPGVTDHRLYFLAQRVMRESEGTTPLRPRPTEDPAQAHQDRRRRSPGAPGADSPRRVS